jgi:hypothetical protein
MQLETKLGCFFLCVSHTEDVLRCSFYKRGPSSSYLGLLCVFGERSSCELNPPLLWHIALRLIEFGIYFDFSSARDLGVHDVLALRLANLALRLANLALSDPVSDAAPPCARLCSCNAFPFPLSIFFFPPSPLANFSHQLPSPLQQHLLHLPDVRCCHNCSSTLAVRPQHPWEQWLHRSRWPSMTHLPAETSIRY